MTPARWLDLGFRDYAQVWHLQKELVERRARDELPNLLLFVEHGPVITLGRSLKTEPIDTTLPIYEVERGGAATFHGPGQLVGYPILKLERSRGGLHRYLRDVEEALVRALGDFRLAATRRSGLTGVWVESGANGFGKIASIGVAVRHWITYHGFALNVNTDLTRFRGFNPCGLDSSVMTSMAQVLGHEVPMPTVREVVLRRFAETFDWNFVPGRCLGNADHNCVS